MHSFILGPRRFPLLQATFRYGFFYVYLQNYCHAIDEVLALKKTTVKENTIVDSSQPNYRIQWHNFLFQIRVSPMETNPCTKEVEHSDKLPTPQLGRSRYSSKNSNKCILHHCILFLTENKKSKSNWQNINQRIFPLQFIDKLKEVFTWNLSVQSFWEDTSFSTLTCCIRGWFVEQMREPKDNS